MASGKGRTLEFRRGCMVIKHSLNIANVALVLTYGLLMVGWKYRTSLYTAETET